MTRLQCGSDQVSSVGGQWSSGKYQVMMNLKLKMTKVFGAFKGGFVSEYGGRGRMADVCLESALSTWWMVTKRPGLEGPS